MASRQHDLKTNSQIRKRRQELALLLITLYLEKKKESDFNQASFNTLTMYKYIFLVNDGTTQLKETDLCFEPDQLKLSKIKKHQARYQRVARAKEKWAAFIECLQNIAYALAAASFPSFILAAGILTAQMHVGTIAAVLFFIILGSLSLLGIQAYLWFHHQDEKPSRYDIVSNRFRQFYKQDFLQEVGPKIYEETDIEGVLSGEKALSVLQLT